MTSVRDLANDHDTLQAIRNGIEAGDEIGPRIMMVGIIDGRGPFAGPTKMLIETDAEGQAIVDDYAKWGYAGIKIYSSVKPELVPGLVRAAHAKGLSVNGHVPAHMTARQFVEAGADQLQHINFVFLNFFDDVKDTRTPARFKVVAERGVELDLGGPEMRSFVELLRERGTVVDPTLVAFEDMFLDRPGRMGPSRYRTVGRMPPLWQRFIRAASGGLETTPRTDVVYRESYRRRFYPKRGWEEREHAANLVFRLDRRAEQASPVETHV